MARLALQDRGMYSLDILLDHKLLKIAPSFRIIAAMDALNFDSGEYTDPFIERKQLLRQLEDSALQREFAKAYNAIIRLNEASSGIVETGHWGCGAYAGNTDLKATLQLLAASAARCTKIIYYCFGVRPASSFFRSQVKP